MQDFIQPFLLQAEVRSACMPYIVTAVMTKPLTVAHMENNTAMTHGISINSSTHTAHDCHPIPPNTNMKQTTHPGTHGLLAAAGP
jgi:hypothetical protein